MIQTTHQLSSLVSFHTDETIRREAEAHLTAAESNQYVSCYNDAFQICRVLWIIANFYFCIPLETGSIFDCTLPGIGLRGQPCERAAAGWFADQKSYKCQGHAIGRGKTSKMDFL